VGVQVPPPTRLKITLASEADLRQRDVQLLCASYGYFNVIVVHLDRFDHLVYEDAPLHLCGGFPKRIDIEGGEVRRNLLEAFGDLLSATVDCFVGVRKLRASSNRQASSGRPALRGGR
jgi:hypothetical protein